MLFMMHLLGMVIDEVMVVMVPAVVPALLLDSMIQVSVTLKVAFFDR